MTFKFSRGVYVEDAVTGFKGCVVGRADYLTGCNRYYIQPSVDKDGKHIEGMWIDEHALNVDESKQRLSLLTSGEQRAEPPG
jgi:hypothetical protein